MQARPLAGLFSICRFDDVEFSGDPIDVKKLQVFFELLGKGGILGADVFAYGVVLSTIEEQKHSAVIHCGQLPACRPGIPFTFQFGCDVETAVSPLSVA